MKNHTKCEICDKVPGVLSPRGWCLQCEGEFHEWRSRLPVKCTFHECPHPLSCRIVKRCLGAERSAEVVADLKTDPDLAHVHSAADID